MVGWFDVVKCWDSSLFNPNKLKEIADSLGWGLDYDLVEREALYYDTMFFFLTYFPIDLVFVGGSMINRVYLTEDLRFSFDLDTVALRGFPGKSPLLKYLLELNSILEEKGTISSVVIGDLEVRLGEVVVDVEKDFFPDVLSLKRVMSAMTFGTPLSEYVETRYRVETGKEPYASEFVRLKEDLGFIPRVEEIRIEIGILREGFKGEFIETDVRSLLEPYVKPKLRLKTKVASLETSIVAKLKSLSREFAQELVFDLVRDLCDLRMLELRYDEEKLRRLIEENNIHLDTVLKNVNLIKKLGREVYDSSWHLSLVREVIEWDKLCNLVAKIVKRLK